MTAHEFYIVIPLAILELILLVIGLYFMAMWAVVFKDLPLFHYNLKTTLKFVGITWMATSIARIIFILCYFFDPQALIDSTNFFSFGFPMHLMENVYMLTWSMAATTILFVVIERISASLWLECYERREDKFLIHAMLAFALLVSVVFYSINYAYDLRIFAYRLPYVFIALVAFVSLVVFLYFHFLNKRRLRQALANRSFYSLNERFQLAENVRVGDIAIRQAFIVSGMVMLFVTAVVIISCLNLDIPLYILRSLSYHFLAIYNIAEAFNIAYGHSTFKKLYFDQLRRSLFGPKGSVDSIDATKRHSIRNTDGMVLNFSAREENRIVFTMLENSWR